MERPHFPPTAKAEALQTLGRELQQVLGAFQQQWIEGLGGGAAIAPQDWATFSQLEADIATLFAPSAACQSLEAQLNAGLPAQWSGSVAGSAQSPSTVATRQLEMTSTAQAAVAPPFTLATHNPYANLTEMDLREWEGTSRITKSPVGSDRPPAVLSQTPATQLPDVANASLERPDLTTPLTTPSPIAPFSTSSPTPITALPEPSSRSPDKSVNSVSPKVHERGHAPFVTSADERSPDSPPPPLPPTSAPPAIEPRSPASPVKGLRDLAQWLAADKAAAQTALQTAATTNGSSAVNQNVETGKQLATDTQPDGQALPQLTQADASPASMSASVATWPFTEAEVGDRFPADAPEAIAPVVPEHSAGLLDAQSNADGSQVGQPFSHAVPNQSLPPLGSVGAVPFSLAASAPISEPLEHSRFTVNGTAVHNPIPPASQSVTPQVLMPDTESNAFSAERSPTLASPFSPAPLPPFSFPTESSPAMDLDEVMAALAQQIAREYRQFYGD